MLSNSRGFLCEAQMSAEGCQGGSDFDHLWRVVQEELRKIRSLVSFARKRTQKLSLFGLQGGRLGVEGARQAG